MPLYQPNDIILNGKYKIVKLLGAGAFGEVYLVTHLDLGVQRAIKVAHRNMPGFASSRFEEAFDRFRQEAQIGARLKHDNLIQVFDFYDGDESLHLVMEYATGGSLEDCLQTKQKREEQFRVEEILQILIDVSSGLAVLHDKRNPIVHRDLKPSNILFDENGKAKIADLGLAQVPANLTQRSRLGSLALSHPGTPAYMSPEQESSAAMLRQTSDIYSLGVIAFEIMSGVNYNMVRPGTRLTEYRTDVDEGINTLIAEMLSKDPEKRPWDGGELLERLQNLDQALKAEKEHQAEQQHKEEQEQQKRIEAEQQRERERKEREEDQRHQEQATRQKQEEEARLRRIKEKDYSPIETNRKPPYSPIEKSQFELNQVGENKYYSADKEIPNRNTQSQTTDAVGIKLNKKLLWVFLGIISFVIFIYLLAYWPELTAPKPVSKVNESDLIKSTEEPLSTEQSSDNRVSRKGGHLDQIVVSVVDNASAITQIQAGAIDIYAAGMSSDSLPEIEAAGLDYAQSNGLYYEITFNTYGPVFDQSTGKLNPFSEAKAREALNWLIDRDYINREVYNGGALAKFWSIITNMPDYTKMAETVRRLEAKYAYNPEMADMQMEEVMLGIEGVTREDGMYMFGGEQVQLIMLIRNDSDGTRLPIGDYVANQLETIGFAVDRQYKTSSEASPLWIGGNPADGLFHIYTGAWSATIIDRDEGDNFEFFDTPQSAYGSTKLWQTFNPSERYMELATALAYNNFESLEQRDTALEEMLELALTESIHIWLIDGKNFTPYKAGLNVTYDLAAGVDGSMIWPYTIGFEGQEGGLLRWGQPDLFVDPWNPIAGSNWAFDQSIGRATWGEAYMIDPHTGLLWPQFFERAEITVKEGLPVGKTLDWVTLGFQEEIVVPEDAIVDWDAETQAFITAAEKFPDGTTANVKSVVYYPADLFDTVKWHDGSPLDLGDMIFSWIISLDMGKEASAIYDESYAANAEAILANYKGFIIVSESPLTIEAYGDSYQTDAELNVTTMWPSFNYGEAPWHTLAAAARADEAGELAFSADKANAKSTDTSTVEWFSLVGGPSLGVVSNWLDVGIEESYIPYANVLADFITPEEAAARYENAKNFFAEYGHYNIGTGPYILSEVYLTEKIATLINNPDFAFLADKWNQFGDPKVATIEVGGEGSVVLTGEFAFDVYVTFEGEPYAADEIKDVKGLLYDGTGLIVSVIDGVLVEDGYYTINVPADIATTMEAGASKIEAVVVPYTVAIPSFKAFDFVTVK